MTCIGEYLWLFLVYVAKAIHIGNTIEKGARGRVQRR